MVKRVYRTISAIVFLLLTLSFAVCAVEFDPSDFGMYNDAAVSAALNRSYDSTVGGSTQRVFDYMGYLTDEEMLTLENTIASARTESGRDFVVVISDAPDSIGQEGSETFADDFYDYNCFGESGFLFLIDMSNRLMTISTKGDMIDIIDDFREEVIFDDAAESMSSYNYYGACDKAVGRALDYYNLGTDAEQYRYDDNENVSPYGDPDEYDNVGIFFAFLTPLDILIAAIAGLVAFLIMFFSVKGKYELKGSTYSYDVKNNTDVSLRVKEDNYVTTTVTKTLKQTDNDSGSHGSGTHTSSSGSTHGGGSRGF